MRRSKLAKPALISCIVLFILLFTACTRNENPVGPYTEAKPGTGEQQSIKDAAITNLPREADPATPTPEPTPEPTREPMQVPTSEPTPGPTDIPQPDSTADDTKNSKADFEKFYDTVLVPRYGIADPDMHFLYSSNWEESDYIDKEGNDGLLGYRIIDFANDFGYSDSLMMVERAIYEEGMITLQVHIYQAGLEDSLIHEMSGQMVCSPRFGMENDTVQTAYRLLDDGLYIYFTSAYTFDLHEGGMNYVDAMVYRFDGQGIEKIFDSRYDIASEWPSSDEKMELARKYMPSIADAWFADHDDPEWWEHCVAAPYEHVLFQTLGTTDPDYCDLSTFQLMKKRDEAEYFNSSEEVYGYYDWY